MNIQMVAEGLDFSEGPAWMPDGSLIVTEVIGERITRVFPDVKKETVATPGGGRNVAAVFENTGIASVHPKTGEYTLHGFPDLLPTNICFGGEDMCDAWITLSSSGMVVKFRWPASGLPLACQ